MKISLPFPPADLNPNQARRLHWAKQRKCAREYRRRCWALARAKVGASPSFDERPLPVRIVFHPPDRRARDRDNMIAAFKAGADGVGDAIKVDDACWEPSYAMGAPVKGGQVVVEVGRD